MLILAIVSIKAASDSGLFGKAKTGADSTKIEALKEEFQSKLIGAYDADEGYTDGRLKNVFGNENVNYETPNFKIKYKDYIFTINPITGAIIGDPVLAFGNSGRDNPTQPVLDESAYPNLDFNIENGEAVVVGKGGGSGSTVPDISGSIVIPPKVLINNIEYTVTKIGICGFGTANYGGSPITDIQFPNTITKIGARAFEGCSNLNNVNIPSSVITIENSVFEGCSSLSEITIPTSVTTIGSMAFSGTPWLENQRTSSTNGLVITNNILIDGKNAAGNVIIPNGVNYIAGFAFYDNYIPNSDIYSVEIPNGITYIGEQAFNSANNLTNIIIPNTVTDIGSSAFSGTPWLETQRTNSTNALVIVNDILIDGKNATGNVTIPSNVNIIVGESFYSSNITELIIPENVTRIGAWAFNGWNSNQTIKVYATEEPSEWSYHNWLGGCSANIIYGYTE